MTKKVTTVITLELPMNDEEETPPGLGFLEVESFLFTRASYDPKYVILRRVVNTLIETDED